MSIKVKKAILFIVLLLALCVGMAGYYLFNKGPVDVRHGNATAITADDLYEAFIKDSSAAQKKYSDKILSVAGLVHEVSANTQNKKIILLETMDESAFINCTMEEDAGALPNDSVHIKGICSGLGSGNADLGIKGDVYLTGCYLEK